MMEFHKKSVVKTDLFLSISKEVYQGLNEAFLNAIKDQYPDIDIEKINPLSEIILSNRWYRAQMNIDVND